MDCVRWAVIGAGGIARRRMIPEGIVPSESAELVAVYSPNSGQEVARQFGCLAVSDESELYEHDWQALYVASPVDCHAKQVLRAAASGRHVLCEKPLSLNVDQARQMVTACDQAGVTLGCGFMMRMHAHHRQAAQFIQQGAIGRVTLARAQLSCWYPPIENAWRQDPGRGGGGVIVDLASHLIDLLEMILGQRVASVSCMTGRLVHDYSSEDTAMIMLAFEDGAIGTIDCSFSVPDNAVENRLEFYGSTGSILATGTIGQSPDGTMKIYNEPCGGRYDALQRRVQDSKWSTVDVQPTNLYRAQIENFGAAILSSNSPAVTGAQGLWIQRIIAACYESAEVGRHISLETGR